MQLLLFIVVVFAGYVAGCVALTRLAVKLLARFLDWLYGKEERAAEAQRQETELMLRDWLSERDAEVRGDQRERTPT